MRGGSRVYDPPRMSARQLADPKTPFEVTHGSLFTVLGIDPGETQTGYCLLENGYTPLSFGKVPNGEMFRVIHELAPNYIGIECVEARGMAVGAEVLETARWEGKFEIECDYSGYPSFRARRSDVKLHICGLARATDSNIRQSMIDRFGAPGTKANPGKTYGISKDAWQALAVAAYVSDLLIAKRSQSN